MTSIVVSAILVSLNSTALTAPVIPFRLEFTRVTARAFGRVSRIPGIGNVRSGILPMTVTTRCFSSSVVTRVQTISTDPTLVKTTGIGTVIESALIRPGVCCMTSIALYISASIKMTLSYRWLNSCTATGTMAIETPARSFGTVNPSASGEGCGGMTEVAIQISRRVSRYRSLLADSANARTRTVMTGFAAVNDAGMIESTNESCGCMTNTTIQTGHRMNYRFTGGQCTIMTGRAIIEDTGMIKCPRYETCGDMAHAAIIGSRHMVYGWFSYGRITVTCIAPTLNTLVVKLGTGKGRGVMAHRAILAIGRNMTKTLTCRATTTVSNVAA